MKKLFLVSLLCLALLLPVALLAQTKKVEIDVITLKSGQVFKGEVEEKNDSFVRFKTENGSRVYYMDDISSITKEEKEVPMTSEEKKQYKAQQAQANKEKAKIQHEQNVELWKKRFPDYKRVTGFYADLSASLGMAANHMWEGDYTWEEDQYHYGRHKSGSSRTYDINKFYWAIDAVIGYRFCPYLAVGAGGGVCTGSSLGYNYVFGKIYPISVKSAFLHCGPGSIFADVKFVMEFPYGVAYGGNFDLGYSFPVGKWLHLNTSFQFSFMGGEYSHSYFKTDTGEMRHGYPYYYKAAYTLFSPGLLYRYCFRIGLEF